MSKIVGFDYSSLPADQGRWLAEQSTAITESLRTCSSRTLDIGLRLADIKSVLGGSIFKVWCKAEFAWSYSSACKYIRVAEVFENIDCADRIPVNALEILSQTNTPKSALDEVVSMVRSGTPVSIVNVTEIVARHRMAEFRKGNDVDFVFTARDGNRRSEEPAILARRLVTFMANVVKFRDSVHAFNERMTEEQRDTLVEALSQLASQLRSKTITPSEEPESQELALSEPDQLAEQTVQEASANEPTVRSSNVPAGKKRRERELSAV